MIQFSLERILLLKPDLIFYQDFQKNWIKPLRNKTSLQLIEINLTDTASIYREAYKIINLFKLPANLVEQVEQKYSFQQKSLLPYTKFTYIAIVDRDEDFKRIFAVGQNSYLNELLLFVGGRNLLDSPKDYLPLSEEFFMRDSKPDLIIDFSLQKNLRSHYRNIPIMRVSDPKMTIPDLKFENKILVLKQMLNQLNF